VHKGVGRKFFRVGGGATEKKYRKIATKKTEKNSTIKPLSTISGPWPPAPAHGCALPNDILAEKATYKLTTTHFFSTGRRATAKEHRPDIL